MNRHIIKTISFILTIVMCLTLIPRIIGTDRVFATETKNGNNTCLGTSKIAAPVKPSTVDPKNDPTGKDQPWTGSYVYFGTYNGFPIKFRVLAPHTDEYGGETLFLDSEYVLYNKRFGYMGIWDESSLREELNG